MMPIAYELAVAGILLSGTLLYFNFGTHTHTVYVTINTFLRRYCRVYSQMVCVKGHFTALTPAVRFLRHFFYGELTQTLNTGKS